MNRRTFGQARHLRWPLAIVTLLALGGSVLTSTAEAATPHLPVGTWATLTQAGNGIQVTGWALDPDTHAAIAMDIWVDGHRTRVGANRASTSIPSAYRAYGKDHGFVAQLPEAAGKHDVCVHAMNAPTKTAFHYLGCRTITLNYNPIGHLDTVTPVAGKITVRGWALDYDKPTTALPVTLRVDNVVKATGTANVKRTDVAAVYRGTGTTHGYVISAAVPEGKHTICVVAGNLGSGKSTSICKPVTVSYSPSGAITSLTQLPGGFHVAGWATDPDTTAPVTVTITADGTKYPALKAATSSSVRSGHGFAASHLLPGTKLAPGKHSICVTATNLGAYGKNTVVACKTLSVNFNPSVGVAAATQLSPGFRVTGWATDPDTSAPIRVAVTADGKTVSTVTAQGSGGTHPGHEFTATGALPNGKHTICATAINALYGNANSARVCTSVSLNFNPYGHFDSVTRVAGTSRVQVVGWAIDRDTTAATSVAVTIDGHAAGTAPATLRRADVAKAYPGTGTSHGYSASFAATAGEHTVCVTAINIKGGTGNTALGCKIIDAVHPTVTSAPRKVTAVAGYGGATVTWTAPASDGGAPPSGYVVTATPGGPSTTVGAGVTSTTLVGLKAKTSYSFTVVARNVAGSSVAGRSAAVTTQAAPPPQTSPAPISTSRYIRNIRGSSATDLAAMKREGAADAAANPSGHGYLILLDIGGQDESGHGVVLSAGVRFVSYSSLVKDLEAYVDGYASKQKASAPVTIALGTNNDMDVSKSSGASWANTIVDPVLSHAAKYSGLTIAGADDIEPGFRATYTQSKAWLTGYLASTRAPFVFNGSADGCSPSAPKRGCNNGWTMAGLYYLAAGAAPVRIINLPQIYNDTMAKQWRYISLTGVGAGQPKINFGGALTEYTACRQAGGCGSLTGNSAWTQVWTQLRAEPKLKITSLPYSTDLRIDS